MIVYDSVRQVQSANMEATLILFLSSLLIVSSFPSEEVPVRAPAPITAADCACRCRPTFYQDIHQTIQGNCQTSDTTERRWCFVNGDECSDKFGFDNRFNLWRSYKACSAPSLDSEECMDAAV